MGGKVGRLGADPKELEGRTQLLEVENKERSKELDGLFLRRGAVGREIRVVKGENEGIYTEIWEVTHLCVR